MAKKYALLALLPALVLLQVFMPMIVDMVSSVVMMGVAGYVGYIWSKKDV